MTPDQYCKQKTLKSGSSFYYSFLFLSESKRQAIQAVYAFCREVDDIVDQITESDIARAKLEWWRQEIGHVYLGKAEHPIGKALEKAIAGYALKQQHFFDIIDGMFMDLDHVGYVNFDELKLYCYRVAGVVGLLASEIMGYQNSKTLEYAQHLGLALQLTNIIRDVREDAERGRIYFPLDELKAHNIEIDDILAFQSSAALTSLLKQQTERAHHHYQQAFSVLPECDRYTQRSGLIMANIYRAILEEIEHDHFQVMRQRISLTPIRKLWIAWKTAREQNAYRIEV